MNDLKGIIEDCNKSDLISDKVIKKIIEIIGQEEWNDLHDENSDICTTMGELIITLKGIPDLENKIADIKANCDLAIEGRDIKIKELEKENAELKEKIEVLECDNYNANCNLNLITDQLTKAEEIIKRLKSLIEDVCDINYLSKNNTKLLEKAEQFLKEIEK